MKDHGADLCKEIDSVSRRNAVKTIVSGVTAVAAYNALPAKWGTPIVEQVFLPAHAVTSGMTITGLAVSRNAGDTSSASVVVTISGQVNPQAVGVPVNIVVTTTP